MESYGGTHNLGSVKCHVRSSLYTTCSTDLFALADGILIVIVTVVVTYPNTGGVLSLDIFCDAKHTARAIAALVASEVLNEVFAWE